MKISLVVIFNHRFDDNIPTIKKIYENRFDIILFLVPFYDGNDKSVIPVYECSHQFQGYLIQAYDKLIKTKSDYYLFVSDDMILNPNINQYNLIDELNLNDKDVLLPELIPLNSFNRFVWIHSRYSSWPFFNKATTWHDNIPNKEEALSLFKKFMGYEYPETYTDDFLLNATEEEKTRFIIDNNGDLTIPYPMMSGYSDIFILSKKVLYSVSRTCGVFSAMNLFVEIAFPTSIVLNVPREKVLTIDMTKYKRGDYWENDVKLFEEKYSFSLNKLITEWESDKLFVHPVKLSKWR